MINKIIESKEYDEMLKCISNLCGNEGYKKILTFNVCKMVSNPQKYNDWYNDLKNDIETFYGGIPLYKNNLLSYANELFKVVDHQFKLENAMKDWMKKLSKKYNVKIKEKEGQFIAYEKVNNKLGKEICRELDLCMLDITLKYYLS